MKTKFVTLFMLFVICIAITAHAASSDKGPASVRNTPDVNVVNEPDEPVPVISVGPTRQPFQIQLFSEFSSNLITPNFRVPSNKRMVIELITVSGQLTPEMQLQFLAVETTVANPVYSQEVVHRLKIPKAFAQVAIPTPVLFSADYSLRLYADPGTVVRFNLFAGSTAGGTGSVVFTCSGYLVPSDSPSLAP